MRGKRYVERCMWEYNPNKALLERLKYEIAGLKSVRGHSYEAHIEGGGNSDPVAEVTDMVLRLEARMRRTESRVEPVSRLKADIDAGCYRDRYVREIFKLRYMERGSVSEVMEELKVSPSTYWRGNDRLILIARKYFGFYD